MMFIRCSYSRCFGKHCFASRRKLRTPSTKSPKTDTYTLLVHIILNLFLCRAPNAFAAWYNRLHKCLFGYTRKRPLCESTFGLDTKVVYFCTTRGDSLTCFIVIVPLVWFSLDFRALIFAKFVHAATDSLPPVLQLLHGINYNISLKNVFRIALYSCTQKRMIIQFVDYTISGASNTGWAETVDPLYTFRYRTDRCFVVLHMVPYIAVSAKIIWQVRNIINTRWGVSRIWQITNFSRDINVNATKRSTDFVVQSMCLLYKYWI